MTDAFTFERRRRALHGWLLLSPALIMLTAFAFYPSLATMATSLWSRGTRRNPAEFVGLENFRIAWAGAPWLRYFLNTFLLVSLILAGQFLLCTLAGFAFAQTEFRGRDALFILVLMQLFILPEVLIVENYRVAASLGLLDSILGIGAPYMASAFGIFLMRQAFKSVPKDLDKATRVEGCGTLGVLWRVYVPAARPTYLAYALVSVATHWNNFLWPLIVTNSPSTRPLTVGLSLFGAPENGVDISVISAATVMVITPLLISFLIFQRQFVQAFLTAGVK